MALFFSYLWISLSLSRPPPLLSLSFTFYLRAISINQAIYRLFRHTCIFFIYLYNLISNSHFSFSLTLTYSLTLSPSYWKQTLIAHSQRHILSICTATLSIPRRDLDLYRFVKRYCITVQFAWNIVGQSRARIRRYMDLIEETGAVVFPNIQRLNKLEENREYFNINIFENSFSFSYNYHIYEVTNQV